MKCKLIQKKLPHQRFSVGRYTTEKDVDDAITLVREKVQKLRDLSPLWDMFKDGVDLSTVEWAAH